MAVGAIYEPQAEFPTKIPGEDLCEDFCWWWSFAGGDEDFAAASFAEFKFGEIFFHKNLF